MINEMTLRCSSWGHARKPLSSHGIGRIYCADSSKDVMSDVDVSVSGPLAIDFSSASKDGKPVPLGTVHLANHKTRLKVPHR